MIDDVPDLYEGGGSNGGDPRYSLLALKSDVPNAAPSRIWSVCRNFDIL